MTSSQPKTPHSEPTVLFQGAEPRRAHDTDAGYDVLAVQHAEIQPGKRGLVSVGVKLALPTGTVGLIAPRSGLALKHGITVLNAPGVIDEGFRGEVKVILANLGDEAFHVKPGDKIAQLVIVPVVHPRWERSDHLPVADRGEDGFGSTGITA